MAQLKDLIVNGASRFVGEIFGTTATFSGDVLPTTDNVQQLGDTNLRWKFIGTLTGTATNATTAGAAITALNASHAATASTAYNATTAGWAVTALNASHAATASTAQNATTSGWAITATQATKLTVNAGSVTQPIFFSDGVPTSTSYALNATVSVGTKDQIAYYSNATTISAKAAAWAAWTNGTTAGPQANIQIGNANYQSEAIPSATTNISGIINTTYQTFEGFKKFKLASPEIYDYSSYDGSSQSRYKYLYFKHNTGATVGLISYDVGSASNITAGQMRFDEYSPLSTGSTTSTGFYERYTLPMVASGMTTTKTYSILTTKDPLVVYCETASATQAKVGQTRGFTLDNNKYFYFYNTYANSYNGKITLNINGTGAKDIWINGMVSASGNKTLPTGQYLVYYDGSHYHFRTDNALAGNTISNGERLSTADVEFKTNNYGKITHFLASSSMNDSGTKPPTGDGHIFTLSWDTPTGWGAQIAFGHGTANHACLRGSTNGTSSANFWGNWKYLLDSENYVNYVAADGGTSGTLAFYSQTNILSSSTIQTDGSYIYAPNNIRAGTCSTNEERSIVAWSKGGSISIFSPASGNKGIYIRNSSFTSANAISFNQNNQIATIVPFATNIVPEATKTRYLGTSTYYWQGAYINGNGNIHWNNLCNPNINTAETAITTYEQSRGLGRIVNGYASSSRPSNILFGIKQSSVTIDFTTDGGATWSTNNNPSILNLFNENTMTATPALTAGGAFRRYDVNSSTNAYNETDVVSGGKYVAGYWTNKGIRITFDSKPEIRYGTIDLLIVRFGCAGSSSNNKAHIKIERQHNDDDGTETWTTVYESASTAWNSNDRSMQIYPNLNFYISGNGTSSKANYPTYARKLRITFIVDQWGTAYRYAPRLISIAGYGINGSMGTGATGTGSEFARAMMTYNQPYIYESRINSLLGFDCDLLPRTRDVEGSAIKLTNIHSIGSSTRVWASMYATTFYGALSGKANCANYATTAGFASKAGSRGTTTLISATWSAAQTNGFYTYVYTFSETFTTADDIHIAPYFASTPASTSAYNAIAVNWAKVNTAYISANSKVTFCAQNKPSVSIPITYEIIRH